ncbi:hypothetical protein WDA79_18495 [Streptomyces sp. A475]|uniref:hypothetical protein n=1 Tax=Streptomyces sp. A475 TaxID=3131976 RepID=UPI0030C8F878
MKPHAEIEQVWPRDGRIRVIGRLHGTHGPAASGPWRLLLVRRGRPDHQLRYEAHMDGDRFECELPVGDLTAYEAGSADRWDLHLTDGRLRLRAGRRLDDIRGKKSVMVYPWQPVSGAFGVRPYFTVEDNLALECRA